MKEFIFLVSAILLQGLAFGMGCIALWNKDWPQAQAWLLADAVLTLSTISLRIKR